MILPVNRIMLYDRLLRELVMDYPNSRKIFEVKPEFAGSNMDYVQRLLEEPFEMPIRSRVFCNGGLLANTHQAG